MDGYFEELVQNVQKGEMYSVKMKDDREVYLGIPMIPGRLQNEEPRVFILNVISPQNKKGVYEFLLEEIEFIERKG